MEKDVKEYHYAKEFRKNNVLDKKERMRAVRENAQREFMGLKRKTENNKTNNTRPEFEMAEEIIGICISRYGENLEKLEYADDKKVEEVYRALNNFNNALEREIKKINEPSNESVEEL